MEGGTAPGNIIRLKIKNKIKKKLEVGSCLGEVFCGGGVQGGEGRKRRREELGGELNFVNGVFLRASHSALKAKPPG